MNQTNIKWGTQTPLPIPIWKCTKKNSKEIITRTNQSIRVDTTAHGNYSYTIVDTSKFQETNINAIIIENLINYINNISNKQKMSIEEIKNHLITQKEDLISFLNQNTQEQGFQFTDFSIEHFDVTEDYKEYDYCKEEKDTEQIEKPLELVEEPTTSEQLKAPSKEKSPIFTIIGIGIIITIAIIIIIHLFKSKKQNINNTNN